MTLTKSDKPLKGESKEEVLQLIEDVISLLRLLSIKVNSLPSDSDLLPYIAFTIGMGKFAASDLHKRFMVDQMTRIEKETVQKESQLNVLNNKKSRSS